MLKSVSASQGEVLLSTRDEPITWINLRIGLTMFTKQAVGSLENISLVVYANDWAVLFLPETTWLFVSINFTKMGRVLFKLHPQQILRVVLIWQKLSVII